jgi:signal transduction histidine kinase
MQRDAGASVVRPALLDRLKALCSAFCERRGVDCRLNVREEHTRLEPADADAVYQSVRELLTLYKRRAQTTEIEISSELRPDGSVAFHVGDSTAPPAPGIVDAQVPRDEVALWNIDRRLRDCGAYLELPRELGSWASVVLPGRRPAGS